MKYELDTIPVWDALKEDTECLLCHLQYRAEDSALRFFMGDSVMMPRVSGSRSTPRASPLRPGSNFSENDTSRAWL
jgi:hypothetical protein